MYLPALREDTIFTTNEIFPQHPQRKANQSSLHLHQRLIITSAILLIVHVEFCPRKLWTGNLCYLRNVAECITSQDSLIHKKLMWSCREPQSNFCREQIDLQPTKYHINCNITTQTNGVSHTRRINKSGWTWSWYGNENRTVPLANGVLSTLGNVEEDSFFCANTCTLSNIEWELTRLRAFYSMAADSANMQEQRVALQICRCLLDRQRCGALLGGSFLLHFGCGPMSSSKRQNPVHEHVSASDLVTW